jgi:hypothetical protein
MCINEAKRRKLEEKAFNDLFTAKHLNPKWHKIVRNALAYARENITAGYRPRFDDVSGVLHAIIEADLDFRKHQDANGAREAEWVDLFADYIVDRVLDADGGHS